MVAPSNLHKYRGTPTAKPRLKRAYYLATRTDHNTTQQEVARSQKVVSAQEKPIRLAYGYQRLGGEIIWVGKRIENWVFHIRWCMGPIWKIHNIEIESNALPASAIVTNYLGEPTQLVDPTLAAIIPGFSDTLVFAGTNHGIAHSVVEIPYDDMPDSIDFTAELDGLIVEDTRNSQQVFSINPALQAHHFLTNTFFGPGWTLKEAGTNACANRADELLGGTPRYESHMLLDKPADLHAWVAMFLEAAGAFLVSHGDSFELRPDQPEVAQETHDLRTVSIDNSDVVRLIRQNQQPNIVRVRYTDTSVKPWREDTAIQPPGGDTGGEYPRVSTIRAPYIHDHRVANRLAVFRLNAQTLPKYEVSWIHADDGVRFQRGDRLALDRIPGFSGTEEARVLGNRLSRAENGYFWEISARQYNALIYSDDVQDRITPSGPDIDDPEIPPAVTIAAVTEAPWLDAGGTYQTTLKADWTGNGHAQTTSYRVLFYRDSDGFVLDHFAVQAQGATGNHSARSSPVEVGVAYWLELRAISSRGRPSDAYYEKITATGDALGPPAPVDLQVPTEKLWVDAAGATHSQIDLWWQGSADIWVRNYRIEIYDGPTLEWSATTQHEGAGLTHRLLSANLKSAVLYTCRLITINVEGDESPGSTQTITLVGRTALPADVGTLEATEYNEFVQVSWTNTLGPGDVAHRVKTGLTTDTWDSALQTDETFFMNPADRAEPIVNVQLYDIDPGNVKIFVKAVSFEGLESAIAAETTIDVDTPKGSRGLERPRVPLSLGEAILTPNTFKMYSMLDNHCFGMTKEYQIAEVDGWQVVESLDNPSGGAILLAMYGVNFPNFTGEYQFGMRITFDGKQIFEYFLDQFVDDGLDRNLGLCPIGQLFLSPQLEAGGHVLIGLTPQYMPFNRTAIIETYNYHAGAITPLAAVGLNYFLT